MMTDVKTRIKTTYDYNDKDIIFTVDDGRGKPINISLLELLEENYGYDNTEAVIQKMLEDKETQDSYTDMLENEAYDMNGDF